MKNTYTYLTYALMISSAVAQEAGDAVGSASATPVSGAVAAKANALAGDMVSKSEKLPAVPVVSAEKKEEIKANNTPPKVNMNTALAAEVNMGVEEDSLGGDGQGQSKAPKIASGEEYVKTVVEKLGKNLIPDSDFMAQAAIAFQVPSHEPSKSATLCIVKTSADRIYRIHSFDLKQNGRVRNPYELKVYNDFMTKKKGDKTRYTVPREPKDPKSPLVTYDVTVVARYYENICFTQYLNLADSLKGDSTNAPASAPVVAAVVTPPPAPVAAAVVTPPPAPVAAAVVTPPPAPVAAAVVTPPPAPVAAAVVTPPPAPVAPAVVTPPPAPVAAAAVTKTPPAPVVAAAVTQTPPAPVAPAVVKNKSPVKIGVQLLPDNYKNPLKSS